MNNTITVSIGRNVGSEPMSERRWAMFRNTIRNTILDNLGAIFVDGAYSRGEWDGITETSATWVADVEEFTVPYLEREFARIAREYLQDAIALTVGKTVLVGGE